MDWSHLKKFKTLEFLFFFTIILSSSLSINFGRGRVQLLNFVLINPVCSNLSYEKDLGKNKKLIFLACCFVAGCRL